MPFVSKGSNPAKCSMCGNLAVLGVAHQVEAQTLKQDEPTVVTVGFCDACLANLLGAATGYNVPRQLEQWNRMRRQSGLRRVAHG